jgi:hypothetical protein
MCFTHFDSLKGYFNSVGLFKKWRLVWKAFLYFSQAVLRTINTLGAWMGRCSMSLTWESILFNIDEQINFINMKDLLDVCGSCMLDVNVMPTPKETSRNLPQDEKISILISVVLVLIVYWPGCTIIRRK